MFLLRFIRRVREEHARAPRTKLSCKTHVIYMYYYRNGSVRCTYLVSIWIFFLSIFVWPKIRMNEFQDRVVRQYHNFTYK